MAPLKSSGIASNPSPHTQALSEETNERHLQENTRLAADFDPATTLIRMPVLLAITGLQRATVYKRLKDDPTFPRPVPLSNSSSRGAPVGFVLAEARAWVRARIAAREVAA